MKIIIQLIGIFFFLATTPIIAQNELSKYSSLLQSIIKDSTYNYNSKTSWMTEVTRQYFREQLEGFDQLARSEKKDTITSLRMELFLKSKEKDVLTVVMKIGAFIDLIPPRSGEPNYSLIKQLVQEIDEALTRPDSHPYLEVFWKYQRDFRLSLIDTYKSPINRKLPLSAAEIEVLSTKKDEFYLSFISSSLSSDISLEKKQFYLSESESFFEKQTKVTGSIDTLNYMSFLQNKALSNYRNILSSSKDIEKLLAIRKKHHNLATSYYDENSIEYAIFICEHTTLSPNIIINNKEYLSELDFAYQFVKERISTFSNHPKLHELVYGMNGVLSSLIGQKIYNNAYDDAFKYLIEYERNIEELPFLARRASKEILEMLKEKIYIALIPIEIEDEKSPRNPSPRSNLWRKTEYSCYNKVKEFLENGDTIKAQSQLELCISEDNKEENIAGRISKMWRFKKYASILIKDEKTLKKKLFAEWSKLFRKEQKTLVENNFFLPELIKLERNNDPSTTGKSILSSVLKAAYAYYKIDSSSEASELIYDIALVEKGIILAQETSFESLMRKTINPEIQRDYQQWQKINKQLSDAKLTAVSDRDSLIDMNLNATKIRLKILTQLKVFEEVERTSAISWTAIQQQLKDKEVAIEFILNTYYNEYLAVIIRKDLPQPIVVKLYNQYHLNYLLSNFDKISEEKWIDILYASNNNFLKNSNENIYTLIWQPIDKHLKGIDRIYFSPTAQLNAISFASIPTTDGKRLVEKYQLVQLLSTRNLLNPTADFQITSAAIYGGINYDKANNIDLVNPKIAFNHDVSESEILRGRQDSLFIELPGAERERDSLCKILTAYNIPFVTYSGAKATEQTFYTPKGNSPSLLHLATHGFLRKDKRPDPIGLLGMHQNGIVLAGANETKKAARFNGGFNGFLTAAEIRELDLSNTQLAILSACESGLGSIQGSEGIFGLQRAFKLAGVHYLVLSLWKVNDNATADFMVNFYECLLKGNMPIHQAFRATQLAMQKRYQDPFKWAAFVLVE